MFPIEHLDEFYSYREDEDFVVDENIKRSYIIFLRDFVRHCSSQWVGYIKIDHIQENVNTCTFEVLTTSDEAIAVWYIKELEMTARENVENILKYNLDVWKEHRKNNRKSGKHLSLERYNAFIKIEDKIYDRRLLEPHVVKYWEQIFCNGMFQFNKKNKINKRISYTSTLDVVPRFVSAI